MPRTKRSGRRIASQNDAGLTRVLVQINHDSDIQSAVHDAYLHALAKGEPIDNDEVMKNVGRNIIAGQLKKMSLTGDSDGEDNNGGFSEISPKAVARSNGEGYSKEPYQNKQFYDHLKGLHDSGDIGDIKVRQTQSLNKDYGEARTKNVAVSGSRRISSPRSSRKYAISMGPKQGGSLSSSKRLSAKG